MQAMGIDDDFDFGELIPVTELPKHLPRRGGKTIHVATVWRWCLSGVGGRKLHTVRIGGRRYTTLKWAREFMRGDGGDQVTRPATPAARRRRHERAEAELERAGI